MEEKRIRDLFQQTGITMQAMLEYFRQKNKVLWNSKADWISGSRTIEGLDKYRTFAIYPYDHLTGILAEWDGNSIRGAGIVEGVSSVNVTASFEFELLVSGNTATISKAQYVMHNGASHTSGSANIKKIVGVEPVFSTSLQNIVGGHNNLQRYIAGYYWKRLVGGAYSCGCLTI